MTSVLVVDSDPVVLETTSHQLTLRGCVAYLAIDGEEAIDLILSSGLPLAGLVTNVDLPGRISGWKIARLVRELNPDASVCYLAASGHRDWAVHGVPNSTVIAMPASEQDIADAYFQLRDVANTAQHDADETAETVRLTQIIRRERDALHAHFAYTPSFIAFLDGPDHCYTFANDAYLKLVEREVVGKTVVEVFPEVIAQGFVEILDRVYRSGEDFIAHGVEFNIDLPDGGAKSMYIDLAYRPIRDADQQVTGIFVEGSDLTERHMTQERINSLQNELIHIARVNAMGIFASTLAHELNQPLTSIHNFMAAAAMIAEKQALDPVIVECLQETRRSALRAGDIIRKLREMTSRRAVSREAIALEPALREAVSTARTGRPNAQVHFDLQSITPVRADLIQLQQVILNLVQNAFEAANDSPVELLISTADEGPFVRVRVRDRGAGIEPHIMPHLFESFSTTKSEGMGIGLSLCKTIIEAHGGVIEAANNGDGGATFSFTLPRALTAPEAD